MSGDETFLDCLREQRAGEGRGNEELVHLLLPLFRQVGELHAEGRVAPLDGTARIVLRDGALGFDPADAGEPAAEPKRLRALQRRLSGTLDVAARGTVERDLDTGSANVRVGVADSGAEVLEPVYLPGYTSWELEIGHHDALTDVFALGMLFASLATGLDFTEPGELRRFVDNRLRLTSLSPALHPVLARAIVRMTELDRHARAQDLDGVIARVESYRDVDERADQELDFERIEGFLHADRRSRRRMIQSVLQSRLFDISRRNRLIWFKPSRAMLDLTVASVPVSLNVASIRPEDLFLWNGDCGRTLVSGSPLRLDRYLRLEEAPWIRGSLDQVRSEARRSRAEIGFSQLRLVIAFLNWHNLREDADERIRSPLLLLPVTLTKSRGVRDRYVLEAQGDIAEVNPVLRHHLAEVYGLDLPDQVDLRQADVATFQRVLAAEVARSEPGVTVHLLERPQIRLMREKARRRLDTWRRRSGATGRGLRSELGVEFSYSRSNFNPLGLQLFLQKVKVEDLDLEEHLKTAKESTPDLGLSSDPDVVTTEREVYSIVEHAAGPYDWAVDLTHCTLGNFNYRKMSLVRDYDQMLEEADGQEHPSFDGLFSLDPRDVDAGVPGDGDPAGPYLVVPADPTQTTAVLRARTGRSFIVQGPPGTGKSQTITNLIADFAAQGKRVLFVCQKRAALDVVYQRLARHRLDELSLLIHDAHDDKKRFIADLGATYAAWTSDGAGDDGAGDAARGAIAARLQRSVAALQHYRDALTAPVAGGDAPVVDVVSELLASDPPPELDAESLDLVPEHGEWERHRDAVHEAARALEAAGESPIISDLPLRHLSAAILDDARPSAALRAALDTLDALLTQAEEARAHIATDATSDDLAAAVVLARQIAPLLPDRLPLLDAASAASAELERFGRDHAAAAHALEDAAAATRGWRDPLSPEDTRTALEQARGLAATFAPLRLLSPAWWALRRTLSAAYDFDAHRVRPSWVSILEALDAEHGCRAALGAAERAACESFAFDGSFAELAQLVARLRDDPERTAFGRELLARWIASPASVPVVIAAGRTIDELHAAAARVFSGGERLALDDLASLVAETRDTAHVLPDVQDALRGLARAAPEVRRAVVSLDLTADEWDGVVRRRALDQTLRRDRALAAFDHTALARRQAELRRDVDALLETNADAIRAAARRRFRERLAVCSRPASQLSAEEKELKRVYNAGRRTLEREFEKVMRHRSIRDLSEGDSGTVAYDLKPIWLMSPLSVSETVPIHEQRFDVVIFDEASQIPVEEAVPAVYRAPQMIVVGDEMQLPPTSFFAAARRSPGAEDDDDEDDDDLLAEVHYDLEADSFLGHAATKLPSTMLGWHYRSRHEALIRFSNQAFYDGRLRTIPDRLQTRTRAPIVVENVEQADDHVAHVLDRPISHHRLTNAPYERRTNEAEAAYVARLVRGLLRSGTGLTLGVVAFSEAQQSEIEAALSALAAEDADFERELEAEYEREDDGQLVGLFVRNLENVQGDERDVIILSICYGPDASGKMRMNFGPINKGGGEKRLNVVFSRSKRHMVVVSSIQHTAITNEYNDGALCFRRYLQYSEAASVGDDATAASVMRALAPRRDRDDVHGPEHPLVTRIVEALRARGLAASPRYGSSEFRVDVAVAREPDDRWTVAVLTDAPPACTELAVLEQNHVRPGVLRAFGWTVVNVLCKEWLADPEACVLRIERALHAPEEFEREQAALDELVEEPPPAAPAPGAVDTDGEGSPAHGPGDAPETLAGKTVVFTGRLGELTRADAAARVRDAGGRVGSSVNASTDLLVVGERPGSKLRAAERHGVAVIDERAFLELLARLAGGA